MADTSDKKKKEPSNVVVGGRKSTDWLNRLAKESFDKQRKYADASNAFRTQLVREAQYFARRVRETMPTSAVQINQKAVELTACQTYPKEVGHAIVKRIDDAMKKFVSSKEGTAKNDDGKAERVLYDIRCGLRSVSDCYNILKGETVSSFHVESMRGERHKKTFTLSKGAQISFAAVINVLADVFMEEVRKKFEERYAGKKEDQNHMISLVEVREAVATMASLDIFCAVPDVFDTGSHKRKRVKPSKKEDAPNAPNAPAEKKAKA